MYTNYVFSNQDILLIYLFYCFRTDKCQSVSSFFFNITLKMSDDDDKPPAPPVRLTSNR